MVRRSGPDARAVAGPGGGRQRRLRRFSGAVSEATPLSAALHPELTPQQRRDLLRRGVELYRDGRYFDCHEAFEEVWRSTTPEPKDLIQGLIQIAVGVYHYRRGKPLVSARVLAKGRRRVQPYPSPTLGLDLWRLLDDVRRWEEALGRGDEPGPPPELYVVDSCELR